MRLRRVVAYSPRRGESGGRGRPTRIRMWWRRGGARSGLQSSSTNPVCRC